MPYLTHVTFQKIFKRVSSDKIIKMIALLLKDYYWDEAALKILDLLITYGADVNATLEYDSYVQCNEPTFEEPEINYEHLKNKCTPLMFPLTYALEQIKDYEGKKYQENAIQNLYSIVKSLINAGAEPTIKDDKGKTALDLVREIKENFKTSKFTEMFCHIVEKILCKGADKNES